MGLSLSEQETTVTATRVDSVWRISSSNPAHIRRMDKEPLFTRVRTGDDYAEFEIAYSDWNPITGRKRVRVLTDEQRQAAAERLRKARTVTKP